MQALDALVAAVMAQRSWHELTLAMKGGYCPTIRPESRRKRLLAKVIHAAGYPTFDGRRVVR